MDIQLILCAIMVAGCAVFIVYLVLTGNEDRIADRLAHLSAQAPARPIRSTKPAVAGTIPRLGQSRTAREIDENEERNTLRGRIVQAGLYKPQAMAVFSPIRIFLCFAPVLAGFVASSMGMVSRNPGLVFGLIAGVLGTIAPSLYLDHLKRKRQTQIRRALPDALDVIVVCLEGGLSVPADGRQGRRPLLDWPRYRADHTIRWGLSIAESGSIIRHAGERGLFSGKRGCGWPVRTS